MRIVQILVRCDGAPGQECPNTVDESVEPIVFGWGGKQYQRDLCTTHYPEFISLMHAIAAKSVPVEEEKPARNRTSPSVVPDPERKPRKYKARGPQPRMECPTCGQDIARQSLRIHLKSAHPEVRDIDNYVTETLAGLDAATPTAMAGV